MSAHGATTHGATTHGAARALLLAWIALLAVAPYALLAVQSASGGWRWPAPLPSTYTGAAWRDVLAGGALTGAALTSAALATATALLAVALGLPLGRAMARATGWARHVAAAGAFLPVAAPPIALGTGLQVALLAAGLGGTTAGVLVAHLVPATAYAALLLAGAFALRDVRAEEAARTLGASPRQTLARVVLPAVARPTAEAAAVAFLVSWSQVALTLVVGGGAVRTLPLELFAYVRAGEDARAAVGALLLAAPAAAALGALRWAARRGVAG